MIDVLIKTEVGNRPVATAQSNNNINAVELHVLNLDPANLIHLGSSYQVGYDNSTNMIGRTCTAINVNARTATFVRAE